jgi:predicted dienelactone hydrolase
MASEEPVVNEYDPFVRGRFPVGVRTVHAVDAQRDRQFGCEIWYPAAAHHAGQDLAAETQDIFRLPPHDTARAQTAIRAAAAEPGRYPLIMYSHPSGAHRRAATFLCTHLSSHGYVVAALDHSEVVAPDLMRRDGETAEQTAARREAVIASRVPDVRFLLDQMLTGSRGDLELDPARVGIVGHSFGGWTALAATEADRRIRAVVALAPGGASRPRPGILPLTLSFRWGRDVPTLYLVAEGDTSLPLAGMYELFARTPATKRMVVLRRADHAHFMDQVAQLHDMFRTMPDAGELASIQKDMRPMAELCSEEQAHLFVRGLTLCHLDATLRCHGGAHALLHGNIVVELARRGVEASSMT